MLSRSILFCSRQRVFRKSLYNLERRMSSINKSSAEEVSIPVPFGHISGELWNGSGNEIPIVAIHGWLDNAGTWDTLLPLINPNFPILTIDLPGHGLSSPRPAGIGGSFLDNVVTLDRVINYFKWDKVILMGHSMGASVSTMYAGTVPEKVVKAIYIDGGIPLVSASEDLPKNTARTLKDLPIAEAKLNTVPPTYPYDTLLERLVTSYNGQVTVESAKCLLRRGAKKQGDDLYSFSYSPLERVHYPIQLTLDVLESYISRINCDILFIKAIPGENYGQKFNEYFRKCVSHIKQSCSSFELVRVEGRHHAHLNDPVPVANYVNKFLEGKPQDKEDLLDLSDLKIGW